MPNDHQLLPPNPAGMMRIVAIVVTLLALCLVGYVIFKSTDTPRDGPPPGTLTSTIK